MLENMKIEQFLSLWKPNDFESVILLMVVIVILQILSNSYMNHYNHFDIPAALTDTVD